MLWPRVRVSSSPSKAEDTFPSTTGFESTLSAVVGESNDACPSADCCCSGKLERVVVVARHRSSSKQLLWKHITGFLSNMWSRGMLLLKTLCCIKLEKMEHIPALLWRKLFLKLIPIRANQVPRLAGFPNELDQHTYTVLLYYPRELPATGKCGFNC